MHVYVKYWDIPLVLEPDKVFCCSHDPHLIEEQQLMEPETWIVWEHYPKPTGLLQDVIEWVIYTERTMNMLWTSITSKWLQIIYGIYLGQAFSFKHFHNKWCFRLINVLYNLFSTINWLHNVYITYININIMSLLNNNKITFCISKALAALSASSTDFLTPFNCSLSSSFFHWEITADDNI